MKLLISLWQGLTWSDGRMSHTKFWSSVAYAVATWVIIYTTINSGISTELLAIYIGTVAGHNILLRSKFMGVKTAEPEDPSLRPPKG